MSMDLLITVVGLIALILGAEVMIRGAVDVALRARITPLVVGLTVVSMGTSLPELLVSVLAALKGNPAVAVGNVVGSNIANISLVLGASVLIFPIEVDRDAKRIHWPVMMIASLIFVGLLYNDLFSRWEGLLFVIALVIYVTFMVRSSRRKHAVQGSAPALAKMPLWRSLLMLVIGIGVLGLGADWFVEGAVGLAATFGVSDRVIGLTVVAVGTSLPELVTSLMAALRKQPDISLGNLVGSNIFNLLGILGVTAVVRPIVVDSGEFLLDLVMMLGLALILLPLMRLGPRLGRWQGALLFTAYVTYLILVLQKG